MKQKRCLYCGDWYTPDPRTAAFQKSCGKKACRQRRKSQAQDHWLDKNPNHFRGPDHYLQQKDWLTRHPGYLRRYRAKHPDYVVADNRKRRERKLRQKRQRTDMKDAMLRREIAKIRDIQGADMKDTIRLRLDELLVVLARPPRADMKDDIASRRAVLVPCSP